MIVIEYFILMGICKNDLTHLLMCWAAFIKEVNPRLAEMPLNFSDSLHNLGLILLSKSSCSLCKLGSLALTHWYGLKDNKCISGLVQAYSNSITNAVELLSRMILGLHPAN